MESEIQLLKQCIAEGDQAGLMFSTISGRAELGWYYGFYGALEKGFEIAEKALRLVDEKQQPAFRAFPLATIVRLHLMKGDLESAQSIAGPEPLQPAAIPYVRYTIMVYLANIELALARTDYEQSLSLVDDLLTLAAPLTRASIPEVLQHKASALIGLNRLDKAHQTLTQACSLAEEMSSKHHLWSIYLDLADVNIRLDQPKRANAFRKKARLIIEEIAVGLEELGLSQSFLKQPRVRGLMEE